MLTSHKQTAGYFSSRDGFLQTQQAISVQGLQPWRAMCKPPYSQGRRSLRERKKKLEGLCKLWFSPWLFTGGVIARKESFLFLQGSEMVTAGNSSPFQSPSSIYLLRFQLTNFLHRKIHDKAILKIQMRIGGVKQSISCHINKQGITAICDSSTPNVNF